jgi:hypothetical protein
VTSRKSRSLDGKKKISSECNRRLTANNTTDGHRNKESAAAEPSAASSRLAVSDRRPHPPRQPPANRPDSPKQSGPGCAEPGGGHSAGTSAAGRAGWCLHARNENSCLNSQAGRAGRAVGTANCQTCRIRTRMPEWASKVVGSARRWLGLGPPGAAS